MLHAGALFLHPLPRAIAGLLWKQQNCWGCRGEPFDMSYRSVLSGLWFLEDCSFHYSYNSTYIISSICRNSVSLYDAPKLYFSLQSWEKKRKIKNMMIWGTCSLRQKIHHYFMCLKLNFSLNFALHFNHLAFTLWLILLLISPLW